MHHFQQSKSFLFLFYLFFISTFSIMLVSNDHEKKDEQPTFFTVYNPGDIPTRLQDVAGMTQLKIEFEDIIVYLQDPVKFDAMGAKIAQGILMYGPTGNGKTLMAKAIAGQTQCTLICVTGSSFVEKFIGTGAARVRELFDAARKNSPCIIFIDEIDAFVEARSSMSVGGDKERNQTIAAFLAEMDGLQKEKHGIFIIAATNRLDSIDTAVVRPGRFDRKLLVDKPLYKDRYELLQFYLKKIPHTQEIPIQDFARATVGFSCAEIEHFMNESALLAIRQKKSVVTIDDLKIIFDDITVGKELKNITLSEQMKKKIAITVAAQLVAYLYADKAHVIDKVFMNPRGKHMGFVRVLPITETIGQTESNLRNSMIVALSPSVAQQMSGYDKHDGNVQNFAYVRRIAHDMVVKYGMSKKFPYGVEQNRQASIDVYEAEEKIIDECLEETENLMKLHHDELKKIADFVIKKETILGSEIRDLVGITSS